VKNVIAAARVVQRRWATTSVRQRLAVVKQLRFAIAENAAQLAQLAAAPNERPASEKMTSEVIPILDACRFLERNARRILHPEKFGARGRPLWLRGSSFVVERRPFGVVLVVGPGNYPLFLSGVQMLQALVAGNAVLLKPAEGCSAPMRWLMDALRERRLIDRDLVQLLPEPRSSAEQAVRAGVDKVVFTGSSENGRRFLSLLAEQNTPGVFELAGADIVLVRQDADLEHAASAIAFGRRLNAGQTCMVPQTVLVHETVHIGLTSRLRELGLSDLAVRAFPDDHAALALAQENRFGLGASIFSADERAARGLARQLPTGFVTINDLIAPTADPRFPFGGVRASGFGTTRGAEGLRELTYAHVVAVRRGRWRPHLAEPREGDEQIFAAYSGLAYGRVRNRLGALRQFVRAVRQRGVAAGAPPVKTPAGENVFTIRAADTAASTTR
jgi:acyl-CoA reductase-like NAD-dependent aldehyde dehydrogenase